MAAKRLPPTVLRRTADTQPLELALDADTPPAAPRPAPPAVELGDDFDTWAWFWGWAQP